MSKRVLAAAITSIGSLSLGYSAVAAAPAADAAAETAAEPATPPQPSDAPADASAANTDAQIATVLVTARLFEGFERKPVERPTHRWVVVDYDSEHRSSPPDSAESSAAVELTGEEPAA